MKINCQSCGNSKSFLLPLWVRTTFKFNEDGTISILHVKQLESLEEKLTNQGRTSFTLTCKECGSDAEVVFNEYEDLNKLDSEKRALEGL